MNLPHILATAGTDGAATALPIRFRGKPYFAFSDTFYGLEGLVQIDVRVIVMRARRWDREKAAGSLPEGYSVFKRCGLAVALKVHITLHPDDSLPAQGGV